MQRVHLNRNFIDRYTDCDEAELNKQIFDVSCEVQTRVTFFNIDIELSHECRDAEKHIYFIDKKRLEFENVLESWQEKFIVQTELIMIFLD